MKSRKDIEACAGAVDVKVLESGAFGGVRCLQDLSFSRANTWPILLYDFVEGDNSYQLRCRWKYEGLQAFLAAL